MRLSRNQPATSATGGVGRYRFGSRPIHDTGLVGDSGRDNRTSKITLVDCLRRSISTGIMPTLDGPVSSCQGAQCLWTRRTSDHVSYYEIPARPGETETIVPIGRPVHNTQLYLLNRWLEPVPIGVPGEICVAGIQVGRGYLNRPDLTAEKFIPNPFDTAQDGPFNEAGTRLYRTGDLGCYREDGAIEFLGRIDHQVKIRGVRIEPGEIEAQLLTFPDIERALVTVREGGAFCKMLVSYVVCNSQFINSDAELFAKLREHLATRLPDAMMPSAFVRLDAMPLGANGKIDRKGSPAPDMSGQSDRAYIAPRIRRGSADRYLESVGYRTGRCGG